MPLLTARLQAILQGLATGAQLLNGLGDIAPSEWKPWIALVIGFVQFLMGWRAHYLKPDGTPL
jgi:hypothetical protein